MESWIRLYLILLGSAFAIATALTWAMVHLAPRVGLIDRPRDHKQHRKPTPVGGGLAILGALTPLLFFAEFRSTHTILILAASLLLALIGLYDDRRHVPALAKFAVLIVLTGLMAAFALGVTTTRIPLLDFAITALWMTGVSSAFNAIDNMDGLAGGVTAIAASSFLVIAVQTRQWELGGLSATLLGASLGFLLFNFHPARIFLGDTGSFFLGFFLASLGLIGQWNENEVIAAIIPILVLGLPVFDLAFTVLRRHQRGVTRNVLQALSHCDTDHLSHRLVRLGLPVGNAVVFLYLIAASFGISALSLRHGITGDGFLHLLQAAVIIAALVPILRLAERTTPIPVVTADGPGYLRARWILGLIGISVVVTAFLSLGNL